jgi:glycerate-2-kinase
VIGPFPWDPFPPGEPDPKGPDPVHAIAYRAAVTGADAYRSVRLALRRESGVLRLGNRFVPDGRYRDVAFVAVGHAANSMALAALHVLGDRLSQGYLAGPEPVAPELPFQGIRLDPGWGGAPRAAEVVRAATEILSDLRESDLFLLLVSPGAVRALLEPPAGLTADEFGAWLRAAHAAGASGREVARLGRVLGGGGAGGGLARIATRADVATFLVDRGDGPALLGGGPMHPVRSEERIQARAIVDRLGLTASLPATARAALTPGEEVGPAPVGRARKPILVASPADAIRPAGDALFDKGWTVRLAALDLAGPPAMAAEEFLAKSDALVRAEALTPESRTKGVVALAMTTLDQPEGPDDGPAFQEFLVRVRDGLQRREMSVGLFRTAGTVGAVDYPGGAVVGASTDPDAKTPPGRARAVGMRTGITDVGLLALAVYPIPRPAGENR